MAPSGLRRQADHDRPVELLGLAVAKRTRPAAWPPAPVRAISNRPDVSLSRRWTSRGRSSKPKRSASSMPSTCRSVPVPPCTASPGGLFSTMTWSSLWMTRRGFPAASRSETVGISRGLGGGAAVTPGGRRMVWPGSTRSLPSARLPSIRTWPVRKSFCRAPWLSSGKWRWNQRSSRRPASSSATAARSGRGPAGRRRWRRRLTLMARNLRDKLNRVHGIAVVRHADLRSSGGLPAGAADGAALTCRDADRPAPCMVILTSSAGVQRHREHYLCPGPERGRHRGADRRQLHRPRRAPHGRRPDPGFGGADGRRRLRSPRAAARRLPHRSRADRRHGRLQGRRGDAQRRHRRAPALARAASLTCSTFTSRSARARPPSIAMPRPTAGRCSSCWRPATTTRRRRSPSSMPSACGRPATAASRSRSTVTPITAGNRSGRCSTSRTPRTGRAARTSSRMTAAISLWPPGGR